MEIRIMWTSQGKWSNLDETKFSVQISKWAVEIRLLAPLSLLFYGCKDQKSDHQVKIYLCTMKKIAELVCIHISMHTWIHLNWQNILIFNEKALNAQIVFNVWWGFLRFYMYIYLHVCMYKLKFLVMKYFIVSYMYSNTYLE